MTLFLPSPPGGASEISRSTSGGNGSWNRFTPVPAGRERRPAERRRVSLTCTGCHKGRAHHAAGKSLANARGRKTQPPPILEMRDIANPPGMIELPAPFLGGVPGGPANAKDPAFIRLDGCDDDITVCQSNFRARRNRLSSS
jgi:hypothetical protein